MILAAIVRGIERLVEQILDRASRPDLHNGAGESRSDGGEVGALEREIDERVSALYGLRPDEIRQIEEQIRGDGAA